VWLQIQLIALPLLLCEQTNTPPLAVARTPKLNVQQVIPEWISEWTLHRFHGFGAFRALRACGKQIPYKIQYYFPGKISDIVPFAPAYRITEMLWRLLWRILVVALLGLVAPVVIVSGNELNFVCATGTNFTSQHAADLHLCLQRQFPGGVKILLLPKLCVNTTHWFEVVMNPSEDVNSCLLRTHTGCSGSLLPYLASGSPRAHRAQVRADAIPSTWPTVPGPSYFGAETIAGIQYGHLTAKLMQYHAMRHASVQCAREITNYVTVYQSEKEMATMPSLLRYTAGIAFKMPVLDFISKNHLFGFHRTRGDGGEGSGMCFDNLYQVKVNELAIASRAHGREWRRDVQSHLPFGAQLREPLENCHSRHRAMVLHRSEGVGLRNFLNPEVLHKVLTKHGFAETDIDQVTLSGRDSPADFVMQIADHSLILSAHSSQLKALIFAAAGTAVVEFRAYDGNVTVQNTRDPFGSGSGMPFINVTYLVSLQKPRDDPAQNHIRADVLLDEELVDAAVRTVLAEQARTCKGLSLDSSHT
jgi:hypothetical protein